MLATLVYHDEKTAGRPADDDGPMRVTLGNNLVNLTPMTDKKLAEQAGEDVPGADFNDPEMVGNARPSRAPRLPPHKPSCSWLVFGGKVFVAR